jgi:hypothetical protein
MLILGMGSFSAELTAWLFMNSTRPERKGMKKMVVKTVVFLIITPCNFIGAYKFFEEN